MHKLHGGGADGRPSLGEANNQVGGNLRGTKSSTVQGMRLNSERRSVQYGGETATRLSQRNWEHVVFLIKAGQNNLTCRIHVILILLVMELGREEQLPQTLSPTLKKSRE